MGLVIVASCVKEESKFEAVKVGGFSLKYPSKYVFEKQDIPLPDVSAYVLRNEKYSPIAVISILSLPNVSNAEREILINLENDIRLGKQVKTCGLIYNRYIVNQDKTYNVSALGWYILQRDAASVVEYVHFESSKIDSKESHKMRYVLSNASCNNEDRVH